MVGSLSFPLLELPPNTADKVCIRPPISQARVSIHDVLKHTDLGWRRCENQSKI